MIAGHEEVTVDQIAKLYDRHDQRMTRVQRLANRATSVFGTPMSLVIIFGVTIV